jgi:hypothetical protein
MISENEQLALFNSPTRVMKAEKALRQAGLACRLIPSPREVAEGCAMALRFASADQGSIFRELAARDLLPRRLYGKEKGVLIPLKLPVAE